MPINRLVIPNGQTCNKFFSLLAPLHHSYTSGRPITVLLPDKALEDFPNLIKSGYFKFPLWNPKLARLIGNKRYEDTVRRAVSLLIVKNPLIPKKFKNKWLWNSWDERGFKVTDELRPLITSVFSPSQEIISLVDKDFSAVEQNERLIIGLHIRRGDYKQFQGGRFYFSDDDWLSFMKALTTQFSDRKILFFISTNEPFDKEKFSDFETFMLTSVQKGAADLYGLSKCDYIVGPPSTFSNWAALVGRKPLCHMQERNQKEFNFVIPDCNTGM